MADGKMMGRWRECAILAGACPPKDDWDCYAKDVCWRFKWTPDEEAAAIAELTSPVASRPADPSRMPEGSS